jgi:methylenetetrahydrofolate reductase (NADPH)
MKIIDIWNARQKPTISFELFPARSEKAAASLQNAIAELTALCPDFLSVTFGAGGSTREGSRDLVDQLKNNLGLEVLAYFACYGLGPDEIRGVLDDYQALGVENVLAVRGDKPREGEFEPHPKSLPHASDLVAYIRPHYGFCIGVAGYPEGHIESPNRDKDLEYLKYKLDCGAEYVITNYFYNNTFFFDFVDRCLSVGIDVPILPGIMPIYSVKMMEMLASLCGATITQEVHSGLAALEEGDKDALIDFGIEFAFQQCVTLIQAGVPGLHIYTMDRSKSSVGLVNKLREADIL